MGPTLAPAPVVSRKRWLLPRLAAALALLATVAAASWLLSVAGRESLLAGPVLVVRTSGGRLCDAFPAEAGDGFSLSYIHSIYGAPAEERFVIQNDDRLKLVSVTSPSRAVLEYYGPAAGDPSLVPPVRTLPLIADRVGRRTLNIAGQQIPLYAFGDGAHLRLQVEHWGVLRAAMGVLLLRVRHAAAPVAALPE